MTFLWCGLALLAVLSCTVIYAISKLAGKGRASEFDRAWFERFSVRRYLPLQRLLSEEDYEFLASLPGYRPEMEKKLRTERRKILRAYLRRLRRDFDRLYLAGRLVALYSPVDRPELSKELLHQQVTFRIALARVNLQVALHGIGIGNVDVSRLLQPLEKLHSELRAALPPAASPAVTTV